MSSTLTDQQWNEFTGRHRSGDPVDVQVTKVLPFGTLVRTASGVPGLVHRPPADSSTTLSRARSDGETLHVRIEAIDSGGRRFSASID